MVDVGDVGDARGVHGHLSFHHGRGTGRIHQVSLQLLEGEKRSAGALETRNAASWIKASPSEGVEKKFVSKLDKFVMSNLNTKSSNLISNLKNSNSLGEFESISNL